MADITTNEPAEQSDDVTAPTEDEQATQTPNDPVEPEKEEPAPPVDDGLAQRLDALEQEVNALKAMLDTLGFDDTTPAESEAEPSAQSETPTVEDLFKD